MYIYIYIHIYVYIYICVYICIYVQIYIYTHTSIHTRSLHTIMHANNSNVRADTFQQHLVHTYITTIHIHQSNQDPSIPIQCSSTTKASGLTQESSYGVASSSRLLKI